MRAKTKIAFYAFASRMPPKLLSRISFTVRSRIEGTSNAIANGVRRLCIFASFDGASIVDPYVFFYLDALRAAGCDIIFVTTSPTIAQGDLEKLRERCRLIVHRKNVGYDFYSHKIGLEAAESLGQYDKILFTNDSVFGPFRNLAPLFARMDAEPEYLWGMCDTWDTGNFHLQSWFVYADRAIAMNAFFQNYWRDLEIYTRKWDIIERCEIGLSTAAQKSGCKIKGLFPYAILKERALALGPKYQYQDELARQDLNPTLKMWDLLLRDLEFPFLKTELLKFNYHGARNLETLDEIVPREAVQALRLARNYCQRIRAS